MDNTIGIVGALTVILLGLALFLVVALHRKRAIRANGFVEIETVNEAINELTRKLFELSPAEVHRKEDPIGQTWLVFVDAGQSEDSGCVMLVYHMAHDDWPAVVLVRSGRSIPKIFRDLTGGIFKWAVPMADSEMNGLNGTGWFAYQEPNREVPSAFRVRLCEAVQVPCSSGLLGIAAIGSYLVVWSDAERLKTVLATAPLVRAAVLAHSQHA